MKTFLESEYRKIKGNIYFPTGARYGREPDTIVFIPLITPTGKYSKYWAILRFSENRNLPLKEKQNKLAAYIKKLEKTFKRELKKGYSIGEPLLYSGKI